MRFDPMATKKTLTYTVVLEPAEEGGYFVSVPALPGCFTQGESEEEALAMAEDVIRLWVESLAADGEPVPVENGDLRVVSRQIKVEAAVQV
jgi:predicted RNase H-like HicB family nuclease